MAKAHRLRFVDSIASSPTVLLDLHDITTFAVLEFDAPPPTLQRSVTASMLTDGDFISATSYGDRVVAARLKVKTSSQDNLETQKQTLARLLDSDSSILEFKRDGATSPVFFRLKRGDLTNVEQMISQTAMDILEFEAPAEPFAYGLPTDITGVDIDRDPTAGTNPMTYALPAIKGDVQTPCYMVTTAPGIGAAANADDIMALHTLARPAGQTHSVLHMSCSDMTLGTGVTATGSAGTGLIGANYINWSASGTTEQTLLTSDADMPTLLPGLYRVYLRCQSVDHTGDKTWQLTLQRTSGSQTQQATRDISLNDDGTSVVATFWLDFGLFQLPSDASGPLGLDRVATSTADATLVLKGSAGAASTALRLDHFLFVPVERDADIDASTGMFDARNGTAPTADDGAVIDGYNETTGIRLVNSSGFADPFKVDVGRICATMSGGFPILVPGANNYITRINRVSTGVINTRAASELPGTDDLAIRYWPRYLYVRPAST